MGNPQYHVRCEPDLYEAVQRAASDCELTPTAWLRAVIESAVELHFSEDPDAYAARVAEEAAAVRAQEASPVVSPPPAMLGVLDAPGGTAEASEPQPAPSPRPAPHDARTCRLGPRCPRCRRSITGR